MTNERRTQKRTFRIIPVRYKKREESLFTVGDIINLTDNGFCLLMPIHLEVEQGFEFEAFDGGNVIKGRAQVIWMDQGHVRAGCIYGMN
jgi:hypothetical protein